MTVIEAIREKVRNEKCECALPRFFEEMANDELTFTDIENAIAHGRIRRRFSRGSRGIRYEVVGPATDGRRVAIICRIKTTGKLLFITTYLLE